MNWLLTNPQVRSTFSSLGRMQGDSYICSPDALAILGEINCKLQCENQTLRTFRRAIGFGQNVKTDLIPLLINEKDLDILDTTIKILVNLTIPVECLFSMDAMCRTEAGRHTIFEINKLLIGSKEAFTDPKSIKAVVDYMKYILENDTKLSLSKCDSINNCLLLLRNILHIPESVLTTECVGTGSGFMGCSTSGHPSMSSSSIGTISHMSNNGNYMNNNSGGINKINNTSIQNTILWNLFIQSIDKLLIHLMSCSQRAYWSITMVQLIALMYKDQHVSTLQKLLNIWFESSLSESSDDNESNTSPPQQGSEGDSSPMLTSDPTSDSSDNGGNGKAESIEDRRLSSHNKDITDISMQHASRKGHEYQNAILRVPAKQSNSNQHQHQNHHQSGALTPMAPPKQHPSVPKDSSHTMKGCDGKHNVTIKFIARNKKQGNFPSPSRTHLGPKSPHGNSNAGVSGSTSVGHINAPVKCCVPKRECLSSQSELSDCGYGTQVENQESISTSSNEDDDPHKKPIHQKPPCNQKQRYNIANKSRTTCSIQDKKELRRKKLVKRNKSNLINMKGLVQLTPTDDDISNILKEFTVDFLLKGYGYLVQELHAQLLLDSKVQIDTSHFFWLITYFLKFAAQLELDLEHVSSVLSFEIISYLTYEGVSLCEQLELFSRQPGSDLKPCLRRVHLVVTAVREFLQAIETYKKICHLSSEDKHYLRLLQIQISSTEDLRCLFILLIRSYNPALHSKQYLQDLIVTNHNLLLLLDSVSKSDARSTAKSIKMLEHIEQFATVEIMYHYGLLLENFRNNSEFVNDCIFTMMHHVGGDLKQIGMLFQPIILKTYSQIWVTEYELCDDWSDLIEYVIHKFMNTPQKSPVNLEETPDAETDKVMKCLENSLCSWNPDEISNLCWYYVQSKDSDDVVGKIMKLFEENGSAKKTRISVIQQLLNENIIIPTEFEELMRREESSFRKSSTKTLTHSTSTGESGIEIKDHNFVSDEVQILRNRLIKENKGKVLIWLQKVLIECCFVKLNFNSMKNSSRDLIDGDNVQIMEAIPYHAILKAKSVPLVPWNSEQAAVMLYQPFILLLHKLGFHLPTDAGKVFIRVPDFWSAEMLYHVAEKLGPIDESQSKFDFKLLNITTDLKTEVSTPSPCEITAMEIFAVPSGRQNNTMARITSHSPPKANTVPDWLQPIMKTKHTPLDRFEYHGTISNENFLGFSSTIFCDKPSTSEEISSSCIPNDEDSAMKSIGDAGPESSLPRRKSTNLESEYSAMVASVYEENEQFNFDTESVASDLTRMYVSDEDEKEHSVIESVGKRC